MTYRLTSVRRDGNRLVGRRSAATTAASGASARVDQVVVNHGTLPLDDLYFELQARTRATSARSTTTT